MPKPGNGWHRQNRAAALARKREYNSAEYKQARAKAARDVAAGRAYCWRPRCRRWIPPGSAWHLGHDDWDRRIIRGPEHPTCNLGGAARKANAQRPTAKARGKRWDL